MPKTKETMSELRTFTEQKILIPVFRFLLQTLPEKFNSFLEWANQKQSAINDYVSNLLNRVSEEESTITENPETDPAPEVDNSAKETLAAEELVPIC